VFALSTLSHRSLIFSAFVAVSPKVTHFTFGDEPLQTGQTTAVTCAVLQGDLPVDITWLLNEHPIAADREDIMTSKISKKSAVLTIESVTGDHAGNYTCRATNAAGVAQYTSELVVNGS